MKIKNRIRTLLIMLVCHFFIPSAFSQFPDKMSYQAVIRNSSGELLTDQLVRIRIQIKQGNEFGAAVYVETHAMVSNTNGLVTLEIGGGDRILGSFDSINWSTGPYFLQTEIDPDGGTRYSINGLSQLLTVPYALHAKTLEGFSGNYSELSGKPYFSKWDKDSTDNVTLTGNQTISGNKKFIGTISAGDKVITNVATPGNKTDAANKAYVDELQTQLIRLKNTVYAGGPVTDIDGNSYPTVKIGNQVWMAENLKVTHYQNGDSIPNVIGNTEWCDLESGACCEYNNLHSYSEIYGNMYNFYAVVDSRGLCPSGWHAPSIPEWMELVEFLGGRNEAGNKLKEEGTAHWSLPNEGATNESGFTALSGGRRDCESLYLGQIGEWWSSTQLDEANAKCCTMYFTSGIAARDNAMKPTGQYVRCLKDE